MGKTREALKVKCVFDWTVTRKRKKKKMWVNVSESVATKSALSRDELNLDENVRKNYVSHLCDAMTHPVSSTVAFVLQLRQVRVINTTILFEKSVIDLFCCTHEYSAKLLLHEPPRFVFYVKLSFSSTCFVMTNYHIFSLTNITSIIVNCIIKNHRLIFGFIYCKRAVR